ncbi:MAG: nucleotidyltransferase family protein [Candidatus Portnoybacteria bacterium]|nr:nucleotidyltransferase family protein [Candidatus Portnoybacteria bacterium]
MTIDEIKQKITPILKQHGITRAAVFGSVARGEAGEKSDIDILVEIPHAHGLFEFIGIKNELEDALEKKVDLIEYQAIKPRIRENILNSQVPIL